MLWALAAVPLAVALYFALATRGRRRIAGLVGLRTTGGAGDRGGRWRRALPPLLWLAALTLLMLALARPQTSIPLPSHLETVVLAIDMSNSMRATDLQPDRLGAARDAAREFVEAQPPKVRIGLVGVAAAAAVVQSPTDRRDEVLQALARLEPQRGTALGSGIVIALYAALPAARIDVEGFISPKAGKTAAPEGKGETAPAGSNTQADVVLLSDGQSNVGPDPQKAAELAARYGVRVYTVGLGTPEGVIVKAEGWTMRARLDEEALRKIAATTGAEYFRAGNAADLKKIYRSLGTTLAFEKQRPSEVTALLAGAAAVLAAFAALLSLAWFNRIL
jgi:Ca-activated chloride channel family protein